MDWNRNICYKVHVYAMFHLFKSNRQLLRLFYYGFGQWCIRFTTPDMVSVTFIFSKVIFRKEKRLEFLVKCCSKILTKLFWSNSFESPHYIPIFNKRTLCFQKYRKRFPYNWKNPTGYLVAVFIQSFMATYEFQYMGYLILLAFGTFMFIIAFVKIMKNELNSINKMASDTKSCKKMYKILSKFNRTYATVRQLSLWIAQTSDRYFKSVLLFLEYLFLFRKYMMLL